MSASRASFDKAIGGRSRAASFPALIDAASRLVTRHDLIGARTAHCDGRHFRRHSANVISQLEAITAEWSTAKRRLVTAHTQLGHRSKQMVNATQRHLEGH
jgi:hypothetical protein